jgi:hypothetical protein
MNRSASSGRGELKGIARLAMLVSWSRLDIAVNSSWLRSSDRGGGDG